MSYDMRYSLINTFKAVDQWRHNILYNMAGVATPGFKTLRTDLGHRISVSNNGSPQGAQASGGARSTPQVAVGHLQVNRTSVNLTDEVSKKVRDSDALPNGATDLAIAGSSNSFFAVAESLEKGARVFLTRGGDFQFKTLKKDGVERQYLTTSSGLFVLRNVDFDPTEMVVKPRSLTLNASSTDEELQKFADELGWPSATEQNYDSNLMVPKTDPKFRSTILKYLTPGIFTSAPRMVDDGNGNKIPNDADFEDPAIMRDALFGKNGHTNGKNTEAEAFELRGLVLPGIGNEGHYTAKGASHIAVVNISDPTLLQVSSWGNATFELPKVHRFGLQVSNNQKTLNATAASNPTNITERGTRIVGHLLETPEASALLAVLSQESEVANYVYKNLSQMLEDYNKSLDELMGLVR